MKIIAIGRNYADHARELNNPISAEPVIFMKPDTALLRDNKPFYLPEFSNEINYEVELVLKISKEGKHIDTKFAKGYFEEIGIGIDFTARDIQQKCKEKGLPWERAKAFDGSAPIGQFKPVSAFMDIRNITFSLKLNGSEVQRGNTQNMLFSFEDIISHISTFVTLKKGDLVFTGTPAGVGRVKIGDRLEAFIEEEKLLDFEIR